MGKIIHETADYSIFKRLEDNRMVKSNRVDKIVQSIAKVGYITSPILVNEKMEVIDGQNRLSALERLKLPVEYIIHEGIGIEECRQMNINQTNWNDYDYVRSFAMGGNENYMRLQSLIDQFDLPLSVIARVSAGKNTHSGEHSIRRGTFKLTKENAEKARWALMYAMDFKTVAKTIGGATTVFYMAVVYAYRNLSIEQRNRLQQVIRKRQYEIPAVGKVDLFLKYFDELYNYGLRNEKKIHLELQYKTDAM